jgi:hypothetical protein
MRKMLLWLGVALYICGVVLILSNVVMHYLGFDARVGLGGLTRFQLSGASFWHLGLGIAVIGAACLMLWRQIAR